MSPALLFDMLASDLDFDLPQHLIAQQPVVPRDQSRLLHLQRAGVAISHHRFCELPLLLRRGDLLVVNDTRVLRARLHGYKLRGPQTDSEGRGARVEALLLREVETNLWQALLRPSARLHPATPLLFVSPDEAVSVPAQAISRGPAGWLVRFKPPAGDVRALLPLLGEVPLPPYIAARNSTESDYQTIFAREAATGTPFESAAAPTAGLHFTPQVFAALAERGIGLTTVTLGIGVGTFRPIQSVTLEEHVMHEEAYEISMAAAGAINAQKQRGGRVVAVGTTTTRVLEAAAAAAAAEEKEGASAAGVAANACRQVRAGSGSTTIFISPGYQFAVVDALVTNFHLPRSSLLAMVAAFAQNGGPEPAGELGEFAGLDKIRYAYRDAIDAGYRFFSFGDAMLIQ
jgi:S-adenosylmethionine:tRNA ribosyltransferase-isomerase